ncbi:MAG: transcriptional regulator NrdR [Saccharofermentans sp.]|nr:transcriptional regulator NrdR [Saccharofermentans sp.]
MICPYCAKDNDKVVDSRASESGYAIRRRRVCLECNGRFSTIEKIEGFLPTVIKKNGTKEPFVPSKLKTSLEIACSKRPVSNQLLTDIVSCVENDIMQRYRQEITSNEIGEYVMKRLYEADKVAYVRFASVYKDFTDPESFAQEVAKFAGNEDPGKADEQWGADDSANDKEGNE